MNSLQSLIFVADGTQTRVNKHRIYRGGLSSMSLFFPACGLVIGRRGARIGSRRG